MLLEKLGLPFRSASPDIDESPMADESPSAYVERLSREKAMALSHTYNDHWIIGSDQCAVLNGDITGKPHTEENAFHQLKAASGQCVEFLTGLCLHHSGTGETFSTVEPFRVHFRDLTDEQIQRYIEKEKPLDCAGSFKSEGAGITLFRRLEGEDPNALIGLPLIRLTDLLMKAGIPVL